MPRSCFASVAVNTLRITLGLLLFWTVLAAGAGAQDRAPMGTGNSAMLREKVEAIQKSMAANKQALQKYQWTETVQLTMNGRAMKPRQDMCSLGPDGKVVRTPIASSGETEMPHRGVMGRIREHKTAETKEHLQQVKTLLTRYLPPEPSALKRAFMDGRVTLLRNQPSGQTGIVVSNYAIPGDTVSIFFNPTTRNITNYHVSTFFGDDRTPVSLGVHFAVLPDGTRHVDQAMIDDAAKRLQVTITNSNYTRTIGTP